jgi:hypothetical protein
MKRRAMGLDRWQSAVMLVLIPGLLVGAYCVHIRGSSAVADATEQPQKS